MTKKESKNLKGWQILVISGVFIVLGTLINNVIGTLILFAGFMIFFFSIAAFVREARAKKS
jgi:hypothetical protein